MPRLSFLLLLITTPLLVGCEGCRRDPEPETEKDPQEIVLEDFSAQVPSIFPADLNPVTGGIKPGHWTTAAQPLKSNKVDARGQLVSQIDVVAEDFQTSVKRRVNSRLPTIRPVVLPRGQTRRFDFRVLTPVPAPLEQRKSFLNSRLISNGQALFYDTGQQPFNVLAGQEFFFVILTSRPERFAKFQVANWVDPPRDEYRLQSQLSNYKIVIPPIDDLLPLSETMLDWTSTAVLVWDDLSADALIPAQQLAVADWVRFGGLFVINGAAASDAIAETSLADLLPLKPTGNIELDADAAAEMLNGHSVASDRSTEKQIVLVKDLSARLAVDGIIRPDTRPIENTAGLLLQRRVGRGRVVQVRFDVTSDWLANWDSYDSFVNNAVLGRPNRKFRLPNNETTVRIDYPNPNVTAGDPAINSEVRLASRDAILPKSLHTKQGDAHSATDGHESNSASISSASIKKVEADVESPATTQSALASRYDPWTRVDSVTGVTSWTDNSDVIAICRQILRDEAGIEIPNSSLVIRSLGYYLLILVPLNYVVFRFLGRLEYAWLAVPLIAIGGAVWVARAAQLDIGFARSQTQLALVELQPEYPRGHLSRVVAIYNSLSSTYQVSFDSVDAAAAPIGAAADADNQTTFRTGFGDGPILSGLSVGSNQVRMLHTEQIVDMGGSVRLIDDGQGDAKVVNETDYDLQDVFVIENSDDNLVSLSAIGGLDRGATASLRRSDVDDVNIPDRLPMQTERFIRRLVLPAAIPPGTSRLVARIETSLPGMSIEPQANQSLSQTILLAHLKHQAIAAPSVDENLVRDFAEVLTDRSDAEGVIE